jgi:hypothetical protein
VCLLPPTRGARPTLGARGASTYTVLGFLGYGVSSVVAAVLMVVWGLPLRDRLMAAFTPPLAFLLVVAAIRRTTGRERIVFYQTATAGVIATALVAAAADRPAARLIDIAVIGIGIFLVFGRLGCFAVACCHGRPARFGVVYGPAHARIGFWSQWVGRRLWPVQLVESAIGLVLVVVALLTGWRHPGWPATVYIIGYGVARFSLELVRGDAARPHLLSISEAQWTATATLVACAIWQPGVATTLAAGALVAATAVLASQHRRRALTQAPHLMELSNICKVVASNNSEERRETSLGVAVSCHFLPDGRRDWILSSNVPAWSNAIARRLANDLLPTGEFVEGRLSGVVHIVES